MSDVPSSTVFQDGNRWYFWDETSTLFLGPFQSESDAQRGLDGYCDYLHTGVYPEFLQSVQWCDGEDWQAYFNPDFREVPE